MKWNEDEFVEMCSALYCKSNVMKRSLNLFLLENIDYLYQHLFICNFPCQSNM